MRVLETGEFERVGSSRTSEVDVRILSATNADLHAEVSAGRFRAGPAVSSQHHRDSYAAAARTARGHSAARDAFSRLYAQDYRKNLSGFESGASRLLLEHPWPGNVRELDHAVERAVLMAQGDRSRPSDSGCAGGREGAQRLEDMSLEEVEAFLIKKALARYEENVSQAANALGLSRSALYRRISATDL